MGITIDLLHELLAFEERYHQGCDKYDVIQKLIDLYAVLIEHYDSIQDPVGFYFNEKLQSLFACQRALKTIRKTNQDQAPFLCEVNNSIQNSQESVKAKQQQAASGEQKKKERQTKAKIAMELQDQTAQQQDNVQSIIEVYDQTIDKVQKTINDELKKQDDAFQQRRLKREKTNLMRKSSRLCSTKCSTERLDVFDSCIEFSNAIEQTQEQSKFKLMNFLKEQSGKISSEETQPIEAVAVEEVQPFEEVQVEEYVESETIVRPHRKQIRESESEDLLDSPPQMKKASYGIVDDANNGDMMLLEDESNLITELNVELQNECLESK